MADPTRNPIYDLAALRLNAGEWKLDAEAGLVFGVRGKAFTATSGDGYIVCKPDARHPALVHRVIWESVHGPIPHGLEVNHLNGIKHDNRIANLEVVTHADNMKHAVRIGLMTIPPPRPRATQCDEHGVERWKFRRDGRGECKECKRLWMARSRRRTGLEDSAALAG